LGASRPFFLAWRTNKPGQLRSTSSPLRSSCSTADISVAPLTKCAVAGRRSIPLCCRLSPLGWDLINLTGDYVWSDRLDLDANGVMPLLVKSLP